VRFCWGVRDWGGCPVGVVTFLFTDVEGSTRRWEADAQATANSPSWKCPTANPPGPVTRGQIARTNYRGPFARLW
jgi:hypothetical protein